MRVKVLISGFLFAVFCFSSLSYSDVPQMINYQGKITTPQGALIDTIVSMTFAIYTDSTGSDSLWSEVHSAVQVEKGIFSVLLGAVNPLSDTVFPGEVRYLGVKVGADPEMTPRNAIVSVAYALRAGTVEGTSGGTIHGDVALVDSLADTTFSIVDGNVHAKGDIKSGNSLTLNGAEHKLVSSIGEMYFGRENGSFGDIKVGIGTISPDEELHVVGNIKMVDGNQAAGKVLTSDANGLGTWQAAAGAGDNDWTFRITDGADTTLMTGGEWGIARSGNTLYGNVDSTHVNLGVECTTGTSGQNYKYCTVGGGIRNTASSVYATVAGGVQNTASGGYATVGGGVLNMACCGFSPTVGGGSYHTASGHYSTIGGGDSNTANDAHTTVAGGQLNTASGSSATVGGGTFNTASGNYATVGGGYYNTASDSVATVAGGRNNTASGWSATIPGGYANVAAGDFSLAAGRLVTVTSTADYTFAFGDSFTTSTPNAVIFHNTWNPIKVGIGTTSPTQRLDVAGTAQMTGFRMPTGAANGYVLTSDASGVGTWQAAPGGVDNDWVFRITDGADTTLITHGQWGIARAGNVLYGTYDSTHVNLGVACTTGTDGGNHRYSTVGGGLQNTAGHRYTTVGGGYGNIASGDGATVGGGDHNTASWGYATVGGGFHNSAGNYMGTVAGGDHNTASAIQATVGGGKDNTASAMSSTVGGGENNTAGDQYATVGGGNGNTASRSFDTVGGGKNNAASGGCATVSGGNADTASGDMATVGGGYGNTASASEATVGGGFLNTASGYYATVAGGGNNTASGTYATAGGGYYNTASEYYATVGGGRENTTSGYYATVAGGYADTVAGELSFAAGHKVRLTSDADYTFAFGNNFATSTSHAVIFYDASSEMKVGIQETSPTARLDVNSSTGYNQIRMRTSYTPTGTSDTNGNVGDIAWDDNYFYVKTSAGWKRATLNTF